MEQGVSELVLVGHVSARVFRQSAENFDTTILGGKEGCSLIEFVFYVGIDTAEEQVLDNAYLVAPGCVVEEAIVEDVLVIDGVLGRLHEFDNVYQIILRGKLHNFPSILTTSINPFHPQQPFTFNPSPTLFIVFLNRVNLLRQYLFFRFLDDLFLQSATEHTSDC